MNGPEQPEADDDVQVEVSTLRPGAGVASTSPTRSPFEPRHSPRLRLVRVGAVLAAVLLVLAVVLNSITGGGIARWVRLAPTPTHALVTGEDLFYLLPNPPGVDILLDGHPLARVPLPGHPPPLHLAPGHHVLVWNSHLFPFMPLRCTISIPVAASDTCPLLGVPGTYLPEPAITLHASVPALSSGDAGQLTRAIQSALAARSSTALVQRGEHYFFYQQGQAGGPTRATQPLRAALTYQFLPNAGYPEPCTVVRPVIPCRFPGQDCSQLCTVAQLPDAVAESPTDWVAAAMVSAAWDYATLDGRAVASNLGEDFGLQLAVLRIAWDGATWHVTPILGHTSGLPAADDAVCDPARYSLSQNGTWSFMVTDPPPDGQAQFASDSTPTDGCVAVLDPHPGSDAPAVFLERFGVLLAVNQVAAGSGSGLPLADAAEQQLARQLAAQAQITIG